MNITLDNLKSMQLYSDELVNYDVKPLTRVVACHNKPSLIPHDPITVLRGNAMKTANITSRGTVEFIDTELDVTEQDVKHAEEIADYYKHKLVTRLLTQTDDNFTKLRNSTFDRDLGRALKLNDEYASKEEYFPILYRLPDFYVEDVACDELVQHYVSNNDPYWSMVGTVMVVGKLSFVRKVVVKKRAYNITAYYFADSERQLVRVPVPKDSVTMPVMNLLERAKSFTMLGSTMSRRLHRDHKDFEVLEPVGSKWDITELEM